MTKFITPLVLVVTPLVISLLKAKQQVTPLVISLLKVKQQYGMNFLKAQIFVFIIYSVKV